MSRKVIPAGKNPFSKAILHNEKYIMDISGQIGMNLETGKLENGIEEQTTRT